MQKIHVIALFALMAAISGALTVRTLNADSQPEQPDFQRMGRVLVEGLMSTPGCLGVETAQTSSGKNVIFAWFKDKDAAMAWHESPAHQRMMDRFFPNRPEGHTPMEHIPGDAGPLLVIASLKPAAQPLPGTRMPVSEIAIETYAPMPGGLRINGGFTPDTVPVPERREVTIAPGAEGRAAPADDR